MWSRLFRGYPSHTYSVQDGQDPTVLNESRIKNDQFIQTSISDVSLWRKSTKKGRPERSDVIHGIVWHHRADYLAVVLENGWDVNERLQIFGSGQGRVKRTALHHAVFCKWHEGVKMLLNAGADFNIKCRWSAETYLPVIHYFWYETIPHFGSKPMKHTPLCVAVYKNDLEMVKLLLQNGTKLNYSGCDYIQANQDQLNMQRRLYVDGDFELKRRENSEVLNELLINGQSETQDSDKRLQDKLVDYLCASHFLPEHLDVLFAHCVHIDPDYQGSTQSHTFGRDSSVNNTRWLIRHGASCITSLYPMAGPLSTAYMILDDDIYSLVALILRYELPMLEVLLQVGIKPPHSLAVYLGDLQMMLQAYLTQVNSSDNGDDDIIKKIREINCHLVIELRPNKKLDQRKLFPIDRDQQMAHLREFSDHLLDVYPKELDVEMLTRQERQEQILKIISNMLHFLKQPNTLQWYCRVCIRQSGVPFSISDKDSPRTSSIEALHPLS